jgi:protein TonB
VPRRADVVTVALAVGVHAGLAFAITRGGAHERPRPSTVELRFSPPKPAVASAPAEAAASPESPPKPAAPAPHRKLALNLPRVHSPPMIHPAATPAAVPPTAAATPRPMVAVAMASTTQVAGAAVLPVGMGGGGPVGVGRPGGAAGGEGGPSGGNGTGAYHPASALEVAGMPEVDTDACGRTVSYPPEAEQAGVEGDVRLRISLTETGRVHAVRVLSGLGHGLDRAAVEAISHRCRFRPAVAKDGRPVPFVIESYTFHFELPR